MRKRCSWVSRCSVVLGLLIVFTLGCTERHHGEAHSHASEEVQGCEICELLPSGAVFRGGPFQSDDLLVHESSFWKVYLFPDDQRYLGRSGVVRREFGAANVNWTCLMNNAFRLHFRPRYAAPVGFGGAVFEDAEFGEHYDREREAAPTEITLAITAALRTAVEQTR